MIDLTSARPRQKRTEYYFTNAAVVIYQLSQLYVQEQ